VSNPDEVEDVEEGQIGGDEIMRRSVVETLPFYACKLCYRSYR
jgi:hypothetical protein